MGSIFHSKSNNLCTQLQVSELKCLIVSLRSVAPISLLLDFFCNSKLARPTPD